MNFNVHRCTTSGAVAIIVKPSYLWRSSIISPGTLLVIILAYDAGSFHLGIRPSPLAYNRYPNLSYATNALPAVQLPLSGAHVCNTSPFQLKHTYKTLSVLCDSVFSECDNGTIGAQNFPLSTLGVWWASRGTQCSYEQQKTGPPAASGVTVFFFFAR